MLLVPTAGNRKHFVGILADGEDREKGEHDEDEHGERQ
jgi:hypothetical protein